ncbi:helix-turn-helix domain-containing protein [Elizabethkingia anophelis]|uniref:helix-turn-helix domain-containing protein n=1 Tax=Elizabethkingia anophelis TaxID=1117645 RepID=UPI0016282A37|nr:helix-turn-helix domain-containing protein [Elizabethkingia anophelis]MDV4116315.1 DNA-binding protein [Elizabethkingia anophelis]
MNIITIEEEAWRSLNERIKSISEFILKSENTSYDSLWLNNHEVCQYLHISEKTLWRMRTKGEIAYSKMYGQYYYTIGAIKNMLNAHAVQTSGEYIQELMARGKSYIEKGRTIKSGK